MIARLLTAYAKFRVWGLPGVWDYVTKKFSWWRYGRLLRTLAARDADRAPVRGITLIGDFTEGASNSKTNRDFAHALKDAGIPFQTFSVDRRATIPSADFEDILTPVKDFRLHKYTHVIEMFRSPLPPGLVRNRSRIAFWEGEHGMFDVWPFLRGTDALIGMSDFNVSYFKKNPDGAPVHKILYPLRRVGAKVPSAAVVRQTFGLGETDFIVFFNFDFGSYRRKNPVAVVRAFAMALRGVPGCRLVFKVQGARNHTAEKNELLATVHEAGIDGQFKMIADYLSHDMLYGLTAATDVYISLHRGEGFGLGMAEAMLFGKPVIATAWSANTEFCRPGASVPVPYQLVPVREGDYFTAMQEWAEADVGVAADALRTLHDDPAYRMRLGQAGKAFVEDHFSLANFKASVNDFLDHG